MSDSENDSFIGIVRKNIQTNRPIINDTSSDDDDEDVSGFEQKSIGVIQNVSTEAVSKDRSSDVICSISDSEEDSKEEGDSYKEDESNVNANSSADDDDECIPGAEQKALEVKHNTSESEEDETEDSFKEDESNVNANSSADDDDEYIPGADRKTLEVNHNTSESEEDEKGDSFKENESNNTSFVSTTEDDEDIPDTKQQGAIPKNLKPMKINDSVSYRDQVVSDSEEDETHDKESADSSVEIIDSSFNAIEVSEDQPSTLKQTKLNEILNEPSKLKVSQLEFEDQVRKVSDLQADLSRTQSTLKVIDVNKLPDKGQSLVAKEASLKDLLQRAKTVLSNMEVDESGKKQSTLKQIAWDEIEAGMNAVGPRTLGKKGIANFQAEKQLAVETLDSLHKSLDTRPTESDLADDPKSLKTELMPHQKRALSWLLWREKQKPSGGLLADDMGLGKTLTMISLILKSIELNVEYVDKENYREKYAGGTLVICPASLINQWSDEIKNRVKRGAVSVEVYHGANREKRAKRLAEHDVVISTYAIMMSENNKDRAPVFGVRWRRIILDEAHQIRNYKSKTSEAIFRLSAKSRWALTGTPIHNKEIDMYATLKFLRCSPFDDLSTWKHWVANKSSGGEMRLHAVISSLMLRRTKAELMAKGALESLPERTWELISVKLGKDEMNVYQKVLIFSRTLFAQFLHQRADKNQDAINMRFNSLPPDPNGEYFKMRNKLLKLNRVREVSQHEILVLLLRLRQICCHPALIKQMLHGDEDLGNAEDPEEAEDMNLLEQLNRLNLDEEDNYASGPNEERQNLKEASRGFLNPSNPIFSPEYTSSKVKTLMNVLKEKISNGDKAIVVSQWTSFLELVASRFEDKRIFSELNGKIPVQKRMEIVNNFNNPKSGVQVLLLSLTAGGVGLNLVGANHLFLLDLHWNPQLESQAQDRIYRLGQKKPIFVYKFMAVDTIEERIKHLQENKLAIADAVLTGSKRVTDTKLSLQDLKMIFGM